MVRRSSRRTSSKHSKAIVDEESPSLISYEDEPSPSDGQQQQQQKSSNKGKNQYVDGNSSAKVSSSKLSKKSASAIHHEQVERDRKARINFLLDKSEIFSHFLDGTGDRLLKNLKSSDSTNHSRKRQSTSIEDSQSKPSNWVDDELMDEDAPTTAYHFQSSPSYITGGKMRDYQIRGLNWLIGLYQNGINGILADEMGLGKTLQTISLLGYMKMHANNPGPHIVICPKSTLANWVNEFHRWCPSINVCTLAGTKDERKEIMENVIMKQDKSYDVIVTSFEICINEKTRLKKLYFGYLIIDEAHRIKNEKSKLSEIVREFNSRNRLLLTGTPLQNNLHELWALLNFLLPDIFSNADDFDSWFNMEDVLGEETTLIKRLHSILQPFLLRRLKSEVEKRLLPKKETKIYVGLSMMQRQWYTAILLKDIDLVNAEVAKANRSGLLNILMQLRKCCNHPYLFHLNRPDSGEYTGEHLVENSGKLKILDKLLKRLQEDGSRVLIFSQMTRMLDLLEEYIQWRGYEYCRIDGQTNGDSRKAQIDAFNASDSSIFIFLLSTRAGGLGINLATADIVVLYDSDWNPQMDLQAMDRAHRIGQKKQVKVFRFITENTVEERIIERAEMKLHLDNIIIQQGRLIDQNTKVGKDEILTMIRSGAEKVFASKESTITDEDIDVILTRGENKTAEMNEKFKSLNENALRNFSLEQTTEIPTSVYDFEGENYRNKKKDSLGINWINPPKRERRVNYAVDKYYNEIMKSPTERIAYKPAPKPPKFPIVFDFQFYPQRLYQLLHQELYSYRNSVNHKEMLNPDLPLEEAKQQQQIEQAKIDSCPTPLTDEEYEERDELLKHGFSNWSKRDFCHFVKALEKHGVDNLHAIMDDVEGKSENEVKDYYITFMSRMNELEDYSKISASIERGKHRLDRRKHLKNALDLKFSQYKYPLYEMKINYGANKGKIYSEDEDRFLLCLLYKLGIDSPTVYEEIVECIRASARFRFDWFIRSRTPAEIRKRCNTLINFIEKEITDESPNSPPKISRPGRKPKTEFESKTASNELSPQSSDPQPTSEEPIVSNLEQVENML